MKTHVSVWLKGVATVCLTGWVAGCAATGIKVVSKTEGGGTAAGQRLLVVSQLASVDETWAVAFGKAMLSELRKAGVPAMVQNRTPLALQSDKVRYASQIEGFCPDLVMVIEPGEGTVDNRGRSIKRKFEAGVFKHYAERGRRELAWRGSVALEPAGAYITEEDMPALARNMTARLTADGILPQPRRKVGKLIEKTGVPPEKVSGPPSRSTRGFGR